MKVKTPKGFTLAELLIVMAIITVLAAVAIPSFTRQLETAREAADMEVIRSAYTEALFIASLDANDGFLDGENGAVELPTSPVKFIEVTGNTSGKYEVDLATLTGETYPIRQSTSGWQYLTSDIMGKTVPACLNSQQSTGGILFATFTFAIGTDGNLALADTTPIAVAHAAAA